MENSDRGPYVSVRVGPVSRTHTFLLDPATDQPRLGDTIVIRTDQGATLATVVPTIGAVAARRALPAQNVLIRRATDDDRAARQRQQRREEEARRSALILIRQLKLAMKLSRVEQALRTIAYGGYRRGTRFQRHTDAAVGHGGRRVRDRRRHSMRLLEVRGDLGRGKRREPHLRAPRAHRGQQRVRLRGDQHEDR